MMDSIRRTPRPRPAVSMRWAAAALAGLAGVILLVAYLGSTGPKTPPLPASLDTETMRIAKNLYCPVCPATPLDTCETKACVQWRALIREKLAAGENEQQITQYLVEQYGERVVGAPRAEGFNLGAYILPITLLAGGAGILLATLRGWQRRPRMAPQARTEEPQGVAPEIAARIARELKEQE